MDETVYQDIMLEDKNNPPVAMTNQDLPENEAQAMNDKQTRESYANWLRMHNPRQYYQQYMPHLSEYMQNIPQIPEGARSGGFSSTRTDEDGKIIQWSYKDLIINWSENTTIHGIKFVTEKSDIITRKFLWLIVVVLFIAFLTRQVNDRVRYYHTNPTSITVEVINNDTLQFPVITICNQNMYRISSLTYNDYYMTVAGYASSRKVLNTSMDKIIQAGFKKEDMIVDCTWLGKRCYADNFTDLMTDHGSCFAFNYKKDLRVSEAGIENGLSVLLNVQQYDYLPADFGPAGIRFLAHSDHEFPQVTGVGMAAPTGSHTYIGVKAIETHNLEEPFGKCLYQKLDYFEDYSESNCVISCRTNYYLEKCGCREYYMPVKEDAPTPICTYYQTKHCIQEISEFFNGIYNTYCNCTLGCRTLSFEPNLSYSTTAQNEATDTNSPKGKALSEKIERIRQDYKDAMDVTDVVVTEEFENDAKLINEYNRDVTNLDTLLNVNLTQFTQLINLSLSGKMQAIRHRLRVWQNITYRQAQVTKLDFVLGYNVAKDRTIDLVGHRFFEFVTKMNYTMQQILVDKITDTDRQQLSFLSVVDIRIQQQCIKGTIYKLNKLTDCYTKGLPYWPTKQLDKNPAAVPRILLKNTVNATDPTWNIIKQLLVNMSKNLEEMVNHFESTAKTKYLDQHFWNDLLLHYQSNCKTWTVQSAGFLENQFSQAEKFVDEREDKGMAYATKLSEIEHIFTQELKTMKDLIANASKLDVVVMFEAANKSQEYLNSHENRTRYFNRDGGRKSNLSVSVFSVYQDKYIHHAQLSLAKLAEKLNFYANQWNDITRQLSDCHTQIEITIMEDENSYPFYKQLNLSNWIPASVHNSTQDILSDIDRYSRDTAESMELLRSFSVAEAAVKTSIEKLHDKLTNYYQLFELKNDFFAKNFLMANFYFQEMSYQKITQQKVYDLTALLSDIGGTLGLFLGCSLLSMVEVVDLLAQIIYHRPHKPKKEDSSANQQNNNGTEEVGPEFIPLITQGSNEAPENQTTNTQYIPDTPKSNKSPIMAESDEMNSVVVKT